MLLNLSFKCNKYLINYNWFKEFLLVKKYDIFKIISNNIC